MLLWGMVNSKIFPGFWAFATALPLVLIHVHILQTILTAYSYFAWLSIHQVITTVISLLFAQLFFKEFPSGVLQVLFILLGIAVQIVGLGLLVSEKVTRNSLMPQRSSNSYLLFNQLNYAFDSDEGSSLELHALGSDSDSDDNMDETSHRHDTILAMSSSSNNNNGGGSIPESQQPPQQQQPNVVIIQNKSDVEDKQPTTPTTTTDTSTTTVVRLDDPLA